MAKQSSRNHFNDSEIDLDLASQEDDPFHQYEKDRAFYKTLENFQPQNSFERELVKGVVYRNGLEPGTRVTQCHIDDRQPCHVTELESSSISVVSGKTMVNELDGNIEGMSLQGPHKSLPISRATYARSKILPYTP